MAPISPSASFLLPINQRGSFFEDAYFQDAREDFHRAVTDVLTRRDRGRHGDRKRDLSCYRRLQRQEDFDEDSQALTITEDEKHRKILLDVKEFHPDGDVKVYALSDQELLVEGRIQDPTTGRVRSFSRRFMLPWYADLSCGFFSVDISSDGVLRIVTTKKAPSTGRSIPLILDYQDINDNECQQESYINTVNNSSSNSNTRKVSFSRNGSCYEESFNDTRGTVNSNSDSLHCTSQQDTIREVPQNHKKGKIIPVVLVKSETNEESNKFSQNPSLIQESAASTNQKGSVQFSTNQKSSSSTSTNKNRPIKTVITTTFDVKSNSNQSIPAKQHEIVIPINIESKASGQRTGNDECTKQQQPHRNIPVSNEVSSSNIINRNEQTESIPAKQHEIVIPISIESKASGERTGNNECTKQQQPHRNIPVSNGISSSPNVINRNEQTEDLSSQNSKVKRIIPDTVEKKKDKTKDADSSKSKTAPKKCFTILNKKTKNNTSDTHKKDMTKDSKRTTHPKEFIIPLTIEGESSDEKPVQKEAVKKVEIGRQDQYKKKNDNKPPINQNKKATSPPKKISISNIFTGQNDQGKEIRSSVTPDKQYNRSESKSNKPPPSPRSIDRNHVRSSSIEERVSMFTKKGPAVERKSRRDFMDEMRGNGRGARSRSSSIEELIVRFDKMSPQAERRVLNRKNSREEKTENFEKKQVVNSKESIIPIEIEGDREKSDFVSMQNCSQNSYSNNNASGTYDMASHNENLNRMENNEYKENSNAQIIIPIVNRKESIIPIKMEYEEDVDNDGHMLSNISPKKQDNDKLNNYFISDHSKVSNASETENENNYASTPSINSITTENYDTDSSPFISSNSTKDKYAKVNNEDDRISSVSSSSIIEDDISMVSADEDSKKTSKGKTKKSSKKKVKRKQSIPGVQVSDDETGERTILLSGRSRSATEKNKNVNNPNDSLIDADDHYNSSQSVKDSNSSSSLNVSAEGCNETEGTLDSLTGFSNENISSTKESTDNIHKKMSSTIPEIPDANVSSELRDTENNNSENSKGINNEKMNSRRSSVLPSPSDLLKIKPPKKNKKEMSEINEASKINEVESTKNEMTGQNSINLQESRRASVLPNPSDLLKIKLPNKNKKEKSETNESSKSSEVESTKNEMTEQNSINLKESRRASVLPNPSDLLKIKPPKKNKKEKSETNESSKNNDAESHKNKMTEQNSINLQESRRDSVLPNPSDLLKIKPPKKSVPKPNASSVSSENSENSKSSQDIQQSKNKSTESEQQQNKTDSQQTQTSKNTYDLDTKDNLNTDKPNENKVLEKIPESTLNPEEINNTENSTTKLEPPPSPSLRRRTSFKKYKVFENKRTPSPSPIRRPDTLTPPKPEQFIINKIEENSINKKEDTNNRKEETSLIKNDPLSSSKKSKTNTCVNIENKDMFFSDPFFKDHRQLFMGGVREALKKSGITSMRDKLRVYRELRLKGQTDDNQAICSAEDETSYKAVFDMTEFLEGEIKVKTMSSTEIVIEATSKSGSRSTPFCHSLPFPDSIIMEDVEASLSEDGILAITAPKTNPDVEV